MVYIKDLILKFESKFDSNNLLDVTSAVVELNIKLSDYYKGIVDIKEKEEYELLLFHSNELLDWLKNYPEDKQDIFATAYDILIYIDKLNT